MIVVYLGLVFLCGCYGYPSGAPDSACNSMTPNHGVGPQNTSPPYVIKLSSSNFTAEENLTITITSGDNQNGTTFDGFLIEVFTNLSDTIRFSGGEFTVPSNAHQTCSGGATHSDPKPKSSISLSWKPTSTFSGTVKFRATVVQTYTTFWENIESQSLHVEYIVPSPPPGNTTDVTTNPPHITTSLSSGTTQTPSDMPRCEKGFGCFKSCSGDACDAVVLWRRHENVVDFRIMSRPTNPDHRWVAIGLSPNGKMARTSVVMCLYDNTIFSVIEGINNGYSFSPLPNTTLGLLNMTASIVDTVMTCSFSRQINVTGDLGDVYSLSRKYYLLLGNGPIRSGKPKRHEHTPVVSAAKVDFLLNQDVGAGDESMLMYKLHGSLMIFAWILLSSLGIIIARYYKSNWKGSMPCGVKVWFAIHRILMSSVFLITGLAFAIIFIKVGTLLQMTDGSVYLKYHPILGITVMALSLVNPVMALFRCKPGHKYRHVFHYSHMFVGMSAQILAATTIYFGVNLEKSNTPVEASYVVIAYATTYALIEFILECEKQYRKSYEDDIEKQYILKSAVTEYSPQAQSHTEGNSFKQSILVLHFLCMTSYSAVLIYMVATA
ncbi:putative ferric-chelate reductase 1 homolog isoform X2 [Ostrea edulis]|nr:putative ferric-chelate reductase 1 homolog isoform X2 [Ostrea edulis]XP_056016298.1 putative ferric-chelate reductase 1 homolog isoform X2 [Ostrea edulis]